MSSTRAPGSVQRLVLAALGTVLLAAEPAGAQNWRTVTSARQLWGAEPVSVSLEYGAGELRVRPADRAVLYEMEMRYDERCFIPVTDFDGDRRTLHLGLRTREGRRNNINLKEGSRATVSLTRSVPLDLKLEFGAGEADIDLGGLQLRRVDLSTGASETRVRFGAPNPIRAERVQIQAGAADLEVTGLGNARAGRIEFHGGVGSTTLDFSGQWEQNAEASVQMGVGSVKLRFPRGLGVRINRSSFLTSFDADGMVKRGGSYFSPNWESAARRLEVDVSAAFGSIDVEWVG